LELCGTIIIKDAAQASIRLYMSPFSLTGKVKQWFYKDKGAIDTWDKCSTAFLTKFLSMGKANALRGKIQISNKIPWNQSPRRGRGYKSTSKPAHTMGLKIGSRS
jgi:hypothetical protein